MWMLDWDDTGTYVVNTFTAIDRLVSHVAEDQSWRGIDSFKLQQVAGQCIAVEVKQATHGWDINSNLVSS